MERRWKVLIVTAVAVFVSFLDVTIVNVAFPDIEKNFAGTAQADLSWVLNAYNIVFGGLLVPAGRTPIASAASASSCSASASSAPPPRSAAWHPRPAC